MTSKSALIAVLILITVLLLLCGLALTLLPGFDGKLPVALLPLPTPTLTPTPEASWLILPEMPETATQADFGAEIYRLVCRDCHGDKGQGLTDEWRATWAPKDQNCWQSKCHAANHPINGFDLPRYVPAIIGPTALARFDTPVEIHEYILVNMPWHNPGSLTNEEYWQLTAFLVRENGGAPFEVP